MKDFVISEIKDMNIYSDKLVYNVSKANAVTLTRNINSGKKENASKFSPISERGLHRL